MLHSNGQRQAGPLLLRTQVNGSSQADSRELEGMEAEEAQEIQAAEALIAQKGSVTGPADEEGLAEFSRMLSVFTHCGRLKVIAQLLRPSNQHSSSILSSIEFDRDSEVHPLGPHFNVLPGFMAALHLASLSIWSVVSVIHFHTCMLLQSIHVGKCKQRCLPSVTLSSAYRYLQQ